MGSTLKIIGEVSKVDPGRKRKILPIREEGNCSQHKDIFKKRSPYRDDT